MVGKEGMLQARATAIARPRGEQRKERSWIWTQQAVQVVHEMRNLKAAPGAGGRHNHTDFIPRACGSI